MMGPFPMDGILGLLVCVGLGWFGANWFVVAIGTAHAWSTHGLQRRLGGYVRALTPPIVALVAASVGGCCFPLDASLASEQQADRLALPYGAAVVLVLFVVVGLSWPRRLLDGLVPWAVVLLTGVPLVTFVTCVASETIGGLAVLVLLPLVGQSWIQGIAFGGFLGVTLFAWLLAVTSLAYATYLVLRAPAQRWPVTRGEPRASDQVAKSRAAPQ